MKAWYIAAACVLALDRTSKLWARRVLMPRETMALWPGVLGMRYATNTGMAFSLGAGGGWVITALTIALVATVLLIHFRARDLNRLTRGALAVIAAGGLGNLIDRLLYGYVVDFIEVQFVRFALFNMADMAICVATGLAMLGLLLKEREKNALDD